MKTLAALLAVATGVSAWAQSPELTESDYRRIAGEQYPALLVSGSPLNRRWLETHNALRASKPAYFQNPAWPLLLADEVAKGLASGSAAQSVRLEVTNIAGGKIIDRKWQASWGSFDRDYTRSKAVKVRVNTVGREKFETTVEVYFIGKTLLDGSRRLASKTSAKVMVDNGPRDIVMHSGPVESSEQRYYAIGEHYVRGLKLEGWYCQVVKDGTVMARAASDPYLRDLYDDPKELARLK